MTRPSKTTARTSGRARRSVSYADQRDEGASSSSPAGLEPADPDDEEVTPGPDAGGDDDEDDGQEEIAQKPATGIAKRKKKRVSVADGTRKSRAKKQTSLSRLPSLPLDVLATIFSAGDLQSLFYLSRLTKKFRAFLVSSSMKGVWLSCWRNSELPESIDFKHGMSILKWANLLYGDCQVCGSKSSNIDAHLRIKACATPKKCYGQITIHSAKLEPAQEAVTPWVASVIPKAGRNNRPVYLLSDFDDAKSAIAAADAALAARGVDAPENEEASQPVQAADIVPGDKDEDAFEHSRYGSMRLVTLKRDLAILVRAQVVEGNAIDAWIASQKIKQADAKSQIQQQRLADIKSRFVALGYEEEYFTGNFLAHKQVRAARPLTENMWPAVRNALQPILEAAREADLAIRLAPIRQARLLRLESQYLVLRRYPKRVKDAGLFPLAAWDTYLGLQSFQNLYFPQHAEITSTSFVDNGTLINLELGRKKESLFEGFYDLLTTSIRIYAQMMREPDPGRAEAHNYEAWFPDNQTPEQRRDTLKQSFAVFTCRLCDVVDAFPRILDHNCGSAPGQHFPSPASLLASDYNVSRKSLQFVVNIRNAAGLTTDAFTDYSLWSLANPHEELESLGNAFSCLTCAPSLDSLGRNWTGMTRHLVGEVHAASLDAYSPKQVVCETSALAQLRLLKAHEDYHNDIRGVYSGP